MKPMPGRRILISGHPPLFRAGLESCLNRARFEVVGQVANVGATLPYVEELQPELVILEMNPPRGSGLGVCRAIRSAYPGTRVLLTVSEEFDDDNILEMEAFLAGASGCVSLRMPAERWIAVISRVLEGHLLFPDWVVWAARFRPELTAREREVLGLIAQGKSDKEIAESLIISPRTVGAHVRNILRKLGARDRGSAVRLWACRVRHRESSLSRKRHLPKELYVAATDDTRRRRSVYYKMHNLLRRFELGRLALMQKLVRDAAIIVAASLLIVSGVWLRSEVSYQRHLAEVSAIDLEKTRQYYADLARDLSERGHLGGQRFYEEFVRGLDEIIKR